MATKKNIVEQEEYTIGSVVDSSDVPAWTRRESKWGKLVDAIEELEPGKSLTVIFPNAGVASRARNTVRDTVNLRSGIASIRTRVVTEENGKTTVFFTRLFPYEVVEEARQEPD